jgi:two-component system nitrogen regulation response regulator NtrX
MKRELKILVCDDDPLYVATLRQQLKGKSTLEFAEHVESALRILDQNEGFDALFLDISMRTPREGLEAIPQFRDRWPTLPILMASGHMDLDSMRQAMRAGAWDYLSKGCSTEEILVALERAFERARIQNKVTQSAFEVRDLQKKKSLIGKSLALERVRRQIEKIRSSQANVLIFGETGTGKEVVARQLRKTISDGSVEPFVAVDSSTIQAGTAESVLFGHRKGAFTGADESRKGVFEEADGGVIYFDEIANMPLSIQPKLLRVIQEKEVLRLGATQPISLEFRVICATNQDLEDLVRKGEFKADLLQRLNVLPIELPPLRERKEDIPELMEYFFTQNGLKAHEVDVSPEALKALKEYSWPGNIRELGNVISYLVAMREGPCIHLSDLPSKITRSSLSSISAGTLSERLEAFERDLLLREYRLAKENIAQMAQNLSVDRSNLYKRLKSLGIVSPK